MKFPTSVAATAGLLITAAACMSPPIIGSTRVDEDEFMLSVQDYRTSGEMTEITTAPYPSALGGGARIRIWVSSFAAAAYRTIDPDQDGAHVLLPEGTLIVREVLAEDGTVEKLTLMGKGGRRYNPIAGDYWYGVTDPDGRPLVDDDGGAMVGRLEECFACHLDRGPDDDFLFGVPADARDDSGPSYGGLDDDIGAYEQDD